MSVHSNTRAFARDVRAPEDWIEGECPVCFFGQEHRCRSPNHPRVLSAVDPQPDPRLAALYEHSGGLAAPGAPIAKHVRNALLCWQLERYWCAYFYRGVSMYPQHTAFLWVSQDERPIGAAVVCRWRREPRKVEWAWVAPDYRAQQARFAQLLAGYGFSEITAEHVLAQLAPPNRPRRISVLSPRECPARSRSKTG